MRKKQTWTFGIALFFNNKKILMFLRKLNLHEWTLKGTLGFGKEKDYKTGQESVLILKEVYYIKRFRLSGNYRTYAPVLKR